MQKSFTPAQSSPPRNGPNLASLVRTHANGPGNPTQPLPGPFPDPIPMPDPDAPIPDPEPAPAPNPMPEPPSPIPVEGSLAIG